MIYHSLQHHLVMINAPASDCLAHIGILEMAALTPFSLKPASEMWDSYIVQFKCVLKANNFTGILDNWKRALFLNYCGPDIFEMAIALFAPAAIQTVPWDTLQNRLKLLRIAHHFIAQFKELHFTIETKETVNQSTYM